MLRTSRVRFTTISTCTDHKSDVVQPQSRRGSLVPGGTSREKGKPHTEPNQWAEEYRTPNSGPVWVPLRLRHSMGGT